MDRLSRRQVVQGVGVAALGVVTGCGQLPWQPPPRQVARIGFLASAVPASSPLAEAFRQGLREHGWVEGQNLLIEYRFGDGSDDTAFLTELAVELVRHPVDIIVAAGEIGAQAARDATSTVPVVMTLHSDPVGTQLVASLARPGGNVTGLSTMGTQLSAKRLELLKDAVPGLTRVAVLWAPISPATMVAFDDTRLASQRLQVQLQSLEANSLDALEAAFATALRERAEALITLQTVFNLAQRTRIAELAVSSRLPSMHPFSEYAAAGGLLAYGANRADLYRRGAAYVDKILRGAPPANLPVEQPTTFDFIINLQTAQALGLTIPPHVLLQATEVIQ